MQRSRLIALTLPFAFMAGACSKHNNAADTASAAGAISPDTTAAATPDTSMRPAGDSSAMAATPSTAAGAGAMLKTANKPGVGDYLTDGSGKALYMFSKDANGTSACMDKCATEWPPFTGTASASDSTVTASMLGTLTRSDGTTQVTYNGKPLYYYQDDAANGDTKGQSKKEFGGSWYLVGPSGMKASAGGSKMKKKG